MRQRKRKKRERARAVSAKRSKRRQTRAIVVFKLRSIWFWKKRVCEMLRTVNNVFLFCLCSNGTSRSLPMSWSSIARISAAIFFYKRKREGRFFSWGESKVVEGTFSDGKILRRRRLIFFVVQSTSSEGVQISPFRDKITRRRYLSVSISLSLYLSPSFPLFPFLSSDRFGLRVVGRGMEFTGTTTFRARGRWRRCCVSFVSENRISTTSFWREVWI